MTCNNIVDKGITMNQDFDKMSNEELWQLFPIFLVAHNSKWAQWYKAEEKKVLSLFDKGIIKRISHIGSTVIPNIWAKNIVDILVQVEDTNAIEHVEKTLCKNGWLLMNKSPYKASLNKGYTLDGFADKVYHLHICLLGDNDELYFRDYLIEHPNAAKEYEQLKLSLWKKFEHDRDGYTEAKSDFIKRYTAIAKHKYNNKYNITKS